MGLRTLITIFSVFIAPLNATDSFNDLVKRGRAAFLASDTDRAEAAYNEACPANFSAEYPLMRSITCESLLASIDEARGNLARAEQRYIRAVSEAEEAGPAFRPLYCARLIDMAEHDRRQQQYADAEASLLKSVNIAREVAAVRPELLPEALIHLGGLYSQSAQPERGRSFLREAIAIVTAEPAGPAAPPQTEVAYAHGALGMIELATGHHYEAQAELRESVRLAMSALGENHPVTAAYQSNLALTLIAERQFGRAGALLRRAQFVVEAQSSPSASELSVILLELSSAANGDGKAALAADYAQRAISLLQKQQRPDAHAIAIAQVALAAAFISAHDTASAEAILPRAVMTQRGIAGNPSVLAASILLLGELRARQRNWHEAEALYRDALALYERSEGRDDNPAVARVLRALAEALKHEGASRDEVRTLESRARDILRSAAARASARG